MFIRSSQKGNTLVDFFCLCTFFALFCFRILQYLFSVCSDARKFKGKCRLFLEDYVILCIHVHM